MDNFQSNAIEQMASSAIMHMLMEVSFILILAVILIISALFDYKERRIPNILSMSGWLLGPILNIALTGMLGLKASLLGFTILFGLTFPFWLLGWMGAGDVKLMGSVGALIGSAHAWFVLLCIVVAGFFFALALLMLKGILGDSVERYRAMIGLTIFTNKPVFIGQGDDSKKETMPYAVPIAFGTLIALLLLY